MVSIRKAEIQKIVDRMRYFFSPTWVKSADRKTVEKWATEIGRLLMHRLADDEAAIAFLETQMPKDKRDILTAIHQSQQQAQVEEQQAPLMMKAKRKSPPQEFEQPSYMLDHSVTVPAPKEKPE
jgi:hypothetical protein